MWRCIVSWQFLPALSALLRFRVLMRATTDTILFRQLLAIAIAILVGRKMDHLYDSVLTHPSFAIPFLCSQEPDYDGLHFDTYPERRHWSTPGSPYGWIDSCNGDITAVAARAQSWLYFGLLETWLGQKLDRYSLLDRGTATTSSPPTFYVSGFRVKMQVTERLRPFFGQSSFEIQEDASLSAPALRTTLKTKCEQFAANIFCCHQALPWSELLDQFADMLANHPDFDRHPQVGHPKLFN